LTLTEAFTEYHWFLLVCASILGALVGSFLNVVIHRLPIMLERQWREQAAATLADPQPGPAPVLVDPDPPATTHPDDAPEPVTPADPGDAVPQSTFAIPPVTAAAPRAADERYNLVTPASRCPKCDAPIRAYQNIPVLSYLALGGRCANCRAPISIRYPLVELATALLSAAVVWRFGWHWQSAAALLFTWALLALTVIDLDHQILPDIITLPLLWVGLLLSLAWVAGLARPLPADPRSAIVGAAAGYLTLWLVFWAFKLTTGREGMGYGDFKLFGAIGAWMGWQMLPLVLLLSAFAGAAIGIVLIVARGRDRNIPLPFGPYLATAAWIALMWGPQIVGGYLDFSGF
jgi:leader peptidase (prepilin peptidase)/N-methyltransferase